MFVCVHIGCGTYNGSKNKKFKDLMRYSCRVALDLMEKNGSAQDAVVAAISVLEDSELTNAGFGSNLTLQGTVECDASIMEGRTQSWCGVGAIPGVKNPISMTHHMLKSRALGTYSLGRIRPIMLVGIGGYYYAKENHVLCVDSVDLIPNYLVTDEKKNKWKELCDKVEKSEQISESIDAHQDTVGAICIDSQGNISSGVSSGGVWLKHTGRVGEAGTFGAGCWARNETEKSVGFGCSCTGTGEDITLGLLAKSMDQNLYNLSLDDAIKESIKNCNALSGTEKKIGLIAVTLTEEKILFGFGFTTQGMGVACFSPKMKDPMVTRLYTHIGINSN